LEAQTTIQTSKQEPSSKSQNKPNPGPYQMVDRTQELGVPHKNQNNTQTNHKPAKDKPNRG
jgi:hypothetical protein